MSDGESGESAGESGESAGCVSRVSRESQISSNKLGEPGGESGYFGIPRSSADNTNVLSDDTSILGPNDQCSQPGM